MKKLLIPLLICIALNGCQTVQSNPSDLLSAQDIKSSQTNGYSSDTMILIVVTALINEKNGSPQTVSRGESRTLWTNRMKDIEAKETKEYYNRVFGAFVSARKEMKLFPIKVIPYK
jgi:hypothetical protein